MEENKTETIVHTNNDCYCSDHPFLKGLLIALLIFAGAFCAFYVVTDWHMKSILSKQFAQDTRELDRAMQKDIRSMNNILKENKVLPGKQVGVIRMERAGSNYLVTIDLRAFDNNENNVQVTTNGNILTINGRTIRKSKHDEQITEFQQNYMFGNNVKLENLEKETKGNYLIISIPIDNGDDD